mgnify:FL=1|jgi:hypothetical protein
MRVQASGRVDQACECKQDFYSELKLTKDACSCQETWVYTGYDEKTYHGCVETYDWPGNTWCWVDGGPGGGKDCPGAVKGSLDIETRFWRTCDPKKENLKTMTCKRCTKGSSSIAGMYLFIFHKSDTWRWLFCCDF